MVEEVVENPTMDEPKKEVVKEKVQEPNVEELTELLKAYDATEMGSLEGKLKASREAGNMANILGEVREQNRQLQGQVAALSNQPLKQQEANLDLDNYEGQTVDLESVVLKTVKRAISEEKQQAAQFQQQQMAKWGQITGDRNYGKVKEIWEDKLKDPTFYNEIYSGMKDPVIAYREVVDDYKDGLLRRSLETINTLKGGGKVAPPHMESGERSPQNLVSEGDKTETEGSKRFKELQKKVEGGYVPTEDEQMELAAAVFGNPPEK